MKINTLEQIEINILWKRLSQDALSKVHLDMYGSYFKFILLLSGDINLNPGPTPSFSIKWMDYQLDPLSVVGHVH